MASAMTEYLRTLYLENLRQTYIHNGKERPRARYPNSWASFDYFLAEGNPKPFSITPSTNVWVWSDVHFGHKNIIKYSDRPFPDVETMDERLIENFNKYVHPNDVSIWVGDVGFYRPDLTKQLVRRCNGHKILVVGNHDMVKKRFPDIGFHESYLLYHMPLPEVDLVFTHYPMTNLPKPIVNIHGHLHINSERIDSDQHINVCCEFYDYRPLNLFEEILPWAKSRVLAMEG